MLFNVSGAVPLFLIEKLVYGVPGLFTTAEPKDIAALLVKTMSVPFNTCNSDVAAGLPVAVTFNINEPVVGSSVEMVIVPKLFVPTADGVAVTVNVALPPAAITAGIVGRLDSINTVAPEVTANEVRLRSAVPVLLIVNVVYGAAGVLIAEVPTKIPVELVVICVVPSCTTKTGVGPLVPVAVTFITNDNALGSSETIVIVPAFAPRDAGVAITFNVSVPFAAIEVGAAGVVVTANPAEPVMDVIPSAVPPVFVIVKDVYAAAELVETAVPTNIAGLALVAKVVVPSLTTITCGDNKPVAVRLIINEAVVGSFEAIVIVPVLAPTAAGVAVTVNVTVPLGAIDVTEAGDVTKVKPEDATIEETFSVAAPLFLIDNVVYAGLVVLPVSAEPINIGAVGLVNCVVASNACN